MLSQKKLSISAREFGRGKASVTRFATLESAAHYIKDRWQGAEYADGSESFHTDYCSYQLHGFALADIGSFGWDGEERTFVFKSDAKPACCADDEDCAEQRSDGFDPRAPFPHASDPHWSDPAADFGHW